VQLMPSLIDIAVSGHEDPYLPFIVVYHPGGFKRHGRNLGLWQVGDYFRRHIQDSFFFHRIVSFTGWVFKTRKITKIYADCA